MGKKWGKSKISQVSLLFVRSLKPMQFIVLNCFVNVMLGRLEDERVEFKEAPNKEVMQFARSVIWTKVPGVVETTCHRDGFSTWFSTEPATLPGLIRTDGSMD